MNSANDLFLRELNSDGSADDAVKAKDLDLVMLDPDFLQWIYYMRSCPVIPHKCMENRYIMKRIVDAMRQAVGNPWAGNFNPDVVEKNLILAALDEMNGTIAWINEEYIERNVTWTGMWDQLAVPGETEWLAAEPKEPYFPIPGPWMGASTDRSDVVTKALSFADIGGPNTNPEGDGFLTETEFAQYVLACNQFAARFGDVSLFWKIRCWVTWLEDDESCAMGEGTLPFEVKALPDVHQPYMAIENPLDNLDEAGETLEKIGKGLEPLGKALR